MEAQQLNEALEATHVAAFAWAVSCCRGDAELAQEVLHDVYAAVLEGRARFGGRSTFKTWLFSVIRFTSASRRRREWVRRLLFVEEERGADAASPESASDHIESDGRAQRLLEALDQLPERQRQVLHLVFYQGLTIDASASVMGVSVGSARTHYARAKARLATLLGDAESL